jgi:hypothetical protein
MCTRTGVYLETQNKSLHRYSPHTNLHYYCGLPTSAVWHPGCSVRRETGIWNRLQILNLAFGWRYKYLVLQYSVVFAILLVLVLVVEYEYGVRSTALNRVVERTVPGTVPDTRNEYSGSEE